MKKLVILVGVLLPVVVISWSLYTFAHLDLKIIAAIIGGSWVIVFTLLAVIGRALYVEVVGLCVHKAMAWAARLYESEKVKTVPSFVKLSVASLSMGSLICICAWALTSRHVEILAWLKEHVNEFLEVAAGAAISKALPWFSGPLRRFVAYLYRDVLFEETKKKLAKVEPCLGDAYLFAKPVFKSTEEKIAA